ARAAARGRVKLEPDIAELRDFPLMRKLKSISKLTLALLSESGSFRNLPPAAERAVEAHEIARNLHVALHEVVLAAQQLRERRVHVQKVHEPFLIALPRCAERDLVLRGSARRRRSLLLRLRIGGQRVVDLLPGAQERLLEIDRGFAMPRFLQGE